MSKYNPLAGRLSSGVALLCLALNTSSASAQTVIITPQKNMDEIVVTSSLQQKPALSTTVPKDTDGKPAADAGDYLRMIPGVTSGRMGGHALEPVIRGQSRSQLNIITDGAFLEGAGPNRMDTPAAFADIDTADVVIVQRGYQSVQYGPGGSGGTIIIEHHAPTFDNGQNIKGRLDGAYESNGDIWSMAGNLAARSGKLYLRLNGHYKEAGNYQDGAGQEVRTAFQSYGGSAEVGYADDNTEVAIGLSREETRDTLFPGAGMDSPEGAATILRGRIRHETDSNGIFQAVKLEAYRSYATHMMNNFSLRDRMMMFRQAELENTTAGGKIAAELLTLGADITIGADVKNVHHDGLRLGNDMDRNNLNLVQSVLIPDATIRTTGLFAEAVRPLSDRLQIKVGLRYDHVTARADKADVKNSLTMPGMMPMSPNMLYNLYYGTMASPQTDNDFGGLLRLEYDINDDMAFYMGVSRSNRSANTVERYAASLMGTSTTPAGDIINLSWFGNPALAPEKHTQFDMGVGLRKADWRLLLSAYYNDINDYIFRDRAHDQDGILLSNNALIYRNIEARIWGFELEGSADLSDKLTLFGNISYTNGQNQDLNIPLYQIPPLSYDLTVTYTEDFWSLGGRLRGAVRQDRVDDNPLTGSGRDAGITDGYAALDIFATIKLQENSRLRFGVSNLFDTLYANHLNRESLSDATVIRVNEPGRSFYARLQTSF
ncbi:MAG: TonB-dependent receptor [Emcibacter sp.]|nr:TonB-dependent receptor [Emcibacter sp.]